MIIHSTAFKRCCAPASVLAIAAVLAVATGCSMSKMAVGAMVPILDNSKNAALRSNDIKTFQSAAPSNLFLLEGLVETDPGKRSLRESASMLYFSYAFTVVEEDPDYASLLYAKGFEHGRAALLKNKKFAKTWGAHFDEFSASLELLDEDDIPALTWTVANWTQFISLHLDSTAVLTQIPRALALLERTVEIDGSYFEGLPYMMLGSLHAFRPPLLGGDPEASLENFDLAFGVSDRKFLLTQVLYAQFYCYRIQDADEFDTALQEVLDTAASELPEYQLLNLIAKTKARTLREELDELF